MQDLTKIDMERPLNLDDMKQMIETLEKALIFNRKLMKWSKENSGLDQFEIVLKNGLKMWSQLEANTLGRLQTVGRVAKETVGRELEDPNMIELSQMRIEREMHPSEMLKKVSFMLSAMKERLEQWTHRGVPDDDAALFIAMILQPKMMKTVIERSATYKRMKEEEAPDLERQFIKNLFLGVDLLPDIEFFRNVVTCLTEEPQETLDNKGKRVEG